MTAAEIKGLLSQNPDAVRFLKKIVRHAVVDEVMPRKIILGPDLDDKSLFNLLNRVLSGCCFSENGKYTAKLRDEMRSSSYWDPLVEAIGYEPKTDTAAIASALSSETVKRLKILFPDERKVISDLAETGMIRSYVGADKDRSAQYLKVFKAFVKLRHETCTTLSQLGSDVFNDSKALRSGAALSQLDKILRTAYDLPDLSVSELHANCGIVDNPYTSHVVVFAPFRFTTGDGISYDYPHRLFQAGQAAVLPWETVQRIRDIQTDHALTLITSENAAPFLALVKTSSPTLYTEGYPNGAVRVLLHHFDKAGAHAVHSGDTDLDGYRIAEQISRFITFDGLYHEDSVTTLPHKPLSDAPIFRIAGYPFR